MKSRTPLVILQILISLFLLCFSLVGCNSDSNRIICHASDTRNVIK